MDRLGIIVENNNGIIELFGPLEEMPKDDLQGRIFWKNIQNNLF